MFRSKKPSPDDPKAAGLPEDAVVIVDKAVDPYVVMFHDPQGYRAEQVRSLRNKLVALNPDGAPKTLVISSAIGGEGKTICAINLALAFSELEHHSAVLVDADLRRSATERCLGLEPRAGVSDLLTGRCTLDEALRDSGVGGLRLIGSGSKAVPAEVLTSSRINDLYDRLKERFQYVVIDTPPILPATDAGVLAARADGTVLVVRLEHSHKRHTREAMSTLTDLGANVLGTYVTEVRGRDPEADARLGYTYDKDGE